MRHEASVELKSGKQIGYAEYGDPNGVPIFYFHGFPGSRLEAARFHDVAASNGFRLIGIDRPGMGLSPTDPKRSILTWAEDIANFADCLKIEKFSVMGHSGGCAFVAACAYAIPQRLNGAAIVSGMAPLEIPESKVGMPRAQRIVNGAIKVMPWLATVMMRLTRMMLKSPNKMIEQMLKQLPEVDQVFFRELNSRKSIIDGTIEAFKNGIVGPSYEMKLLVNRWGFDLAKIACPVTIWHGRLDTQVPISHANIFANLIPGAELKIFENEGHHSLIKNHIEKIMRSLCGKLTNEQFT